MIKVLIPFDKEFLDYETECKNLYESLQDRIGDSNTFDFIKKETFFYMFIDSEGLIGVIYYFEDSDGKIYLNGFSKRKKYTQNIECLKLSLCWFVCDVYAEAQNRASALCLLKCGFKRVKNNLFKKEKGVI